MQEDGARALLTPMQILDVGKKLLDRLGQGWRAAMALKAKIDQARKDKFERIDFAVEHEELFDDEAEVQTYIDFEMQEDQLEFFRSAAENMTLQGARRGGGTVREPNQGDSSSDEEPEDLPTINWKEDGLRRFFLRIFEEDLFQK
jgi:hypothetical protein